MPTIPYKNSKGERLQGITTLKSQQLGWGKQPLMIWANKQGLAGKSLNEARDTATIPGTIAHYLIECRLKRIKPDLTQYAKEDIDKAQIAYNNFKTWWEDNAVIPVAIEPHLVSELWGFGGTPDLVANTRNGLCIIDWKTGKIYEDIFIQLRGYEIAWVENKPEMIIEGFHVLRIPKDEEVPSFHHSFWEKMPNEATDAINHCLGLRYCQERLKQLL